MKPISAKKKVAPSMKVLARAFARRRAVPSESVLRQVFAESGLEQASREGVNAWFKKTVVDAFKKWHVHKDGSAPQVRIVGDEDFSSSQSDLEKSLGAKVQGAAGVSPGKYEIKKAGEKTEGGKAVTYKIAEGKEVKYASGGTGSAYKTAGTGTSYTQNPQGVVSSYAHNKAGSQYSADSGVNVQCSCGMVAHAGTNQDGKIGFSAIGNTKSEGSLYSGGGAGSQYSGGQQQGVINYKGQQQQQQGYGM